jgi:hypothetical protein
MIPSTTVEAVLEVAAGSLWPTLRTALDTRGQAR